MYPFLLLGRFLRFSSTTSNTNCLPQWKQFLCPCFQSFSRTALRFALPPLYFLLAPLPIRSFRPPISYGDDVMFTGLDTFQIERPLRDLITVKHFSKRGAALLGFGT